MAAAEHKSDIELTGELWGVCREDLGENWLHYNGTAWYFLFILLFELWAHKWYVKQDPVGAWHQWRWHDQINYG